MLDAYTRRTRLAAAVLATSPILALGLVLIPVLPGAHKFWSVLALGVTSYAANIARRAGNRIQPALWEEWGGAPTTRRLRFRDSPSRDEVARRHADVKAVVPGVELPTADAERADPQAADREYQAAVGRAINVVRDDLEFKLLAEENRNYGFARNLRGLRPLGIICAVAALAVSAGIGGWTAVADDLSAAEASPLALPAIVAVAALFGWTQVDSTFVRRPAEAYADRLFDALDKAAHRDV